MIEYKSFLKPVGEIQMIKALQQLMECGVKFTHVKGNSQEHTVNVQIFMVTIFRGLNFRGDYFSWVRAAHRNCCG